MNVTNLQTSFFLQLTHSTLLRSFVHIEKSTRKCPTTFERFIATLNKQNSWLCFTSHHDTVCSNCWTRIFVGVAHNYSYWLYSNAYYGRKYYFQYRAARYSHKSRCVFLTGSISFSGLIIKYLLLSISPSENVQTSDLSSLFPAGMTFR